LKKVLFNQKIVKEISGVFTMKIRIFADMEHNNIAIVKTGCFDHFWQIS